MNSGGRPAGTPNDVQIYAAEQAREEDRHRSAIRGHRQRDIAAARMRYRDHKVSRKRLVEIYGRELVTEALGN